MLLDIPDSIIQPEVMISALMDIQIAESAAMQLKTDSLTPTSLIREYYPDIFGHYDITEAEFKRSYTYYTEHPLVLNYIYEKVLEQLNLMLSDPGADTVHIKQPKAGFPDTARLNQQKK